MKERKNTTGATLNFSLVYQVPSLSPPPGCLSRIVKLVYVLSCYPLCHLPSTQWCNPLKVIQTMSHSSLNVLRGLLFTQQAKLITVPTVCLHSEVPLCFKHTHESCCLSTLVYYVSVISACNMSIARDCCAFKIQLCRGALLSEVQYPSPIYGNPNPLHSPSPA